MRPRRGENNQTVPLYEECALLDFLLNAPLLEVLSAETGCSVLQAFNTSTFPEFMAQLVCRSLRGWGGRCGGRGCFCGRKKGEREGVALRSISEREKRQENRGEEGDGSPPSTSQLWRQMCGRKENDCLLDGSLLGQCGGGETSAHRQETRDPLKCTVNGSDLQHFCLSGVFMCKNLQCFTPDTSCQIRKKSILWHQSWGSSQFLLPLSTQQKHWQDRCFISCTCTKLLQRSETRETGMKGTIETKTEKKILGSSPSSAEEYYWNNLELALVDAGCFSTPHVVEDAQQSGWIRG